MHQKKFNRFSLKSIIYLVSQLLRGGLSGVCGFDGDLSSMKLTFIKNFF